MTKIILLDLPTLDSKLNVINVVIIILVVTVT